MERQKLIHLHGKTQLTDASKLNLGEIAVRNANTAEDTELAVLTEDKQTVVYIPSLNKVNSLLGTTVSGLTATVSGATTGDTPSVAVEVKQEDGKLTEVTVTSADIASAKALGELSTKVSENSGFIDALELLVGDTKVETQIGTAISGLESTVSGATTGDTPSVAVEVKQENGKLTGVTVTSADIASATALGKLSEKVGDESVATQIGTAISGLDSTVSGTTTGDTPSVAVEVKQEDGKLTEVTVTTTDIASAKALGELSDKVGDTKVETQIGTAISGLTTTVSGATTGDTPSVAVEVKQENGVLTGVTVTTDDIASATALGELSDKVVTLIDKDVNKSVRTIANEELAAQLIPSGATESLDTLKEIADWIQNHPEDAAKFNTDIIKLQTILTGYGDEENLTKTVKTDIDSINTKIGDDEKGILKDIKELKAAVGDEGSVSEMIETAISGLTTTVSGTTTGETPSVTVEVKQEEGILTGVTVTTDDIASAKALGKLSENAVQTITIKNTETNLIKAEKVGTTYTLDFDKMVIDCGTYDVE